MMSALIAPCCRRTSQRSRRRKLVVRRVEPKVRELDRTRRMECKRRTSTLQRRFFMVAGIRRRTPSPSPPPTISSSTPLWDRRSAATSSSRCLFTPLYILPRRFLPPLRPLWQFQLDGWSAARSSRNQFQFRWLPAFGLHYTLILCGGIQSGRHFFYFFLFSLLVGRMICNAFSSPPLNLIPPHPTPHHAQYLFSDKRNNLHHGQRFFRERKSKQGVRQHGRAVSATAYLIIPMDISTLFTCTKQSRKKGTRGQSQSRPN